MKRSVIGATLAIASLMVSLGAATGAVVAAGPPAGPGDYVASGPLAQGWESEPAHAAVEGSDLEIVKSFIVGGTVSASGALPWMTFLLVEKADGYYQCGGSLIAPKWVLTAAHCVDGDLRAVGAITGRTTAPTRSNDPAFIFAAGVRIDSRYQPQQFGVFDVALVELSTASSAQTLQLAHPGDTRHETPGTRATVAGWGVTADGAEPSGNLLVGEVPVRTSADCQRSFPAFDSDFNTCAGFSTNEASQPVGSCSGDSGGPLFVTTDDSRTRVQVGIVSYGRGQCTSLSHAGVYMRVSQLYESIGQVVSLPTPPAGAPRAEPPPAKPPAANPPSAEPPSTEAPTIEPSTSYIAIDPDRALDTRTNGGPRVSADAVTTIPVGSAYAGRSIAVNLTVTGAGAPGFATLYACDQKQPATSSLNYQASQAIANGVITKVSQQGTVCVTSSQPAHILLDVFGVFPSNASFTPVGPTRAADTRSNGGPRVSADAVTTIPVGSAYAGKSIAVNLTVTGAGAPGFATLYACDQKQPATSSLNYQATQAIANGVITKVSQQGTVCVTSSQPAHILLDVFGVFPSNASFTPVGPTRAADTRLDGGAVGAGTTLTIPVGTQYARKSIAVNLTVAGALDAGFATLYACDQKRPTTSSLNYRAAHAIANGVITEVSAQGTVCVYLDRRAHVLLDVFGVFPS